VDNYTINGNNALAAVVDETNYFVNLITSPVNLNTPYLLTISGLKDRAKQPNLIAANTQIEFILPEWITTDIGQVDTAGTLLINNDEFIMTGSGYNVFSREDEFTYARKNVIDNTSISTRIIALEGNHNETKGGIMFRETIDVSSKLVAAHVSKSGNIMFVYRPAENELLKMKLVSQNVTFPIHLRLERNGNKFSMYQSLDGIDWGEELKNITVAMNSTIKCGLFLCSFDRSVSKATFDNVEINNDVNTSVENTYSNAITESFKILSTYPNPFNPVVNIAISLNSKINKKEFPIQLKIYNVIGQTIYQTQIKNSDHLNSPYVYTWNGVDQYGVQQSSGIYFVGIENGNHRDYRKILLVK
jgi:hypothetical protein